MRPVGQFLTRHFIFSGDGVTWEGYIHYFSDARCLSPMFTVHAAGSYLIGQQSSTIGGAYKFDVKVTQMAVTPHDARIVNLMNEDTGSDACGRVGSWSRHDAQDVTSTGGCAMLGLKVPVLAYELLRVEREHHKTLLYLGQGQTVSTTSSDTQEQSAQAPAQPVRSTSFQAPMVRCGAGSDTRHNAINVVESLTDNKQVINGDAIPAQSAPLKDAQSAASRAQTRFSDFFAAFCCCFLVLIAFR